MLLIIIRLEYEQCLVIMWQNFRRTYNNRKPIVLLSIGSGYKFSDLRYEHFNESNFKAHATKDFSYYNLLRAWKGNDSSFPLNDSHNENYNVRDDGYGEKTIVRLLSDISLQKFDVKNCLQAAL